MADFLGKLTEMLLGVPMQTDWNLIREMMNAAIDTCERVEASGYSERDRGATLTLADQTVSVHDILVSSWTYPEIVRYRIIRSRHEAQNDLPYVPESARILIAMAQASAELVGASSDCTAKDDVLKMVDWFRVTAGPRVQQAVADNRKT